MKNLQDNLQQRKQQHLYRTRKITQGPQGREIIIDKQRVLNFCSNDYLGLANHPDIKKSFIDAAHHYGVGSGSAHLVNGHTQAHHALEDELAEFCEQPRALLFSTGYMANLGTSQSLCTNKSTLFEDKLNHASLLDAAAIKQLNSISQTHNSWLMLDDAHGFGVLGQQGKGSLNHQNITHDKNHIYMATLGKAIGTAGAFIAGSDELIETLIQTARCYIYTTAMPAAIAEATRTSLKLLITENWRQESLQKNIHYFKELTKQTGLKISPSNTAIQPVLIGDAELAMTTSQQLLKNGFHVAAIRPPTVPKNTARLRITLRADHTEKDIEQLVENIANSLNKY